VRAYPDGLVEFPFELTGRGFFPGGDGLWREQSALHEAATHLYPIDGIMFVGQDFGSVTKYPRPKCPWENNNATWKFLTKRIEKSGIPGESCFFTNSLLGLRKEGSTEGQNPCISNSDYMDICREFLAYQIETIDPRLIVIFRSVPEDSYLPLLFERTCYKSNSNISRALCVGRKRLILQTQHPRSDSGVITKGPLNYNARCGDLAQAWALANPPA